jgi:hypothetical protein
VWVPANGTSLQEWEIRHIIFWHQIAKRTHSGAQPKANNKTANQE